MTTWPEWWKCPKVSIFGHQMILMLWSLPCGSQCMLFLPCIKLTELRLELELPLIAHIHNEQRDSEVKWLFFLLRSTMLFKNKYLKVRTIMCDELTVTCLAERLAHEELKSKASKTKHKSDHETPPEGTIQCATGSTPRSTKNGIMGFCCVTCYVQTSYLSSRRHLPNLKWGTCYHKALCQRSLLLAALGHLLGTLSWKYKNLLFNVWMAWKLWHQGRKWPSSLHSHFSSCQACWPWKAVPRQAKHSSSCLIYRIHIVYGAVSDQKSMCCSWSWFCGLVIGWR
jgi:hypothetical protein